MQLRLFKVYEMVLSERQQKAQSLARWLADIGAFVTSPLPLDPMRRLRFQVLHSDRDAVLAKIREQDWSQFIARWDSVSIVTLFCRAKPLS